MAKRKANDAEDGIAREEPRRSSRRKAASALKEESPNVKAEIEKPTRARRPQKKPKEKEPTPEEVNGIKDEDQAEAEEEAKKPSKPRSQKLPLPKAAPAAATASPKSESKGRQYWLMKAEPESRLEKGHDIKFSIDDLASRTKPEPWDGIRAYTARNNLRAMKKGDLAFFYHSSCKVPAIVGIMEIVEEHTPDLSAHDPAAPYHDPTSQPDNPKWSLVHVEFRQKLETPITLKELRGFEELREMQMLKGARVSVSHVREAEWRFLLGEMEKRGDVVDL